MPDYSNINVFNGGAYTANGFVRGQNITGWSIEFIVRSSEDTANPALITKTVGSGITIVNPTAVNGGTYTIALSGTDTALTEGQYFYSIARTDSGAQGLIAYGQFNVNSSTTLG